MGYLESQRERWGPGEDYMYGKTMESAGYWYSGFENPILPVKIREFYFKSLSKLETFPIVLELFNEERE